MIKQHGLSLIEILVSLTILSLLLLGFDALEITALHETKAAYFFNIAMQQLNIMADHVSQMSDEDAIDGEMTLWNKQNQEVLPQGKGSVQGQFPQYVLSIFWGKFSDLNCEQNHIGLSGCARLVVNLSV